MAGLGQLLREAREAKGLTLTEVEGETRIRLSYLEALEAEEFDRLPGEVYVRGFLRNYAQFLGLKSEEVLAQYSGEEETVPSQPASSRLRLDVAMDVPLERSRRASILRTLALIVVMLALIGGGYWGYRTYIETGRLQFHLPAFARVTTTSTVTAPAAIETATLDKATEIAQSPEPTDTSTFPPTATFTPTQTPAPTATPTVTATPTPKVYRGIEVAIAIRDRSWLQVTVDGVRVYEGVLEAGETRTWEGSRRIALRTGNGGGVVVKLNGELIGPLGEPGEVVDVEWVKPEQFDLENPTGSGPVAGASNEQSTPERVTGTPETPPLIENLAG